MFDNDDWDANEPVSTKQMHGLSDADQFSDTIDKPKFGRGRGRFTTKGFGKGMDAGDSKINGFGGKNESSGFGKPKQDADQWNDESDNFGSAGGFGKPGDKNGGSDYGFGKSTGNSFGGFSGRSKGCFKCGDQGHMSRDCPSGNSSGGFGGGSKGCFKCGEDGHISRDCPNNDSSSGFGNRSKGCFKCGEDGHISRDCPSGDSSSGFGGRSKGCFKCGEEGHMSRECPNGGSSRGFGGKSKGCFKCGEEGHMSRECPNGDSSGGFGGKSKGCFKCGEEGHMSRECPNGDSSGGFGGKSKGCFKCGEEGHMSRECPNGDSSGGDGKDRPPIYIPPPPPEEDDQIFNAVERGINFDRYDKIPVEVTGNNAPKFIETFEQACLTETIAANVKRAGYERPTPVQKFSIPIVLSNRDLMSCAQTGSGKTAAFLLPVLTSMIRNGLESSSFSEKQTPQAIVVGPTRELVYQIFLEARKFSRGTVVRPVVAYGGTSTGHQMRELQKGCHMLIATPGRLMDFINRGKVDLSAVQYLILDEADRMLDMGFETEIRKLADSPGMRSKNERHTLMFSATFPDEIQKLAHEFLREDFLFLTVGRVGGACSDVTQTVLQVDQGDKRFKLLELLVDVKDTGARTLVFVETKRSADFLACSLCQDGYPATSIHGDRFQQEREEALRDFKSGKCPILIATSVAARGLDIPKVQHVVNYDLPSEIDEYVHRIGRTGRCGNLGLATSFYDDSQNASLARSLVKILSEAQQEVPPWLEGCADAAVGTSFGSDRGRFGGRDARKGFGNNGGTNQGFGGGSGSGTRSTADCDYNDAGGFGGGDDDDGWD